MKRDEGFTTIELLVTLFIAALFIVIFYQIYGTVTQSTADINQYAAATGQSYGYLRQTSELSVNGYLCSDTQTNKTASPYTTNQPVTNTSILTGTVSETLSLTNPFGCLNQRPVLLNSTTTYGAAQRTISHAAYVAPVPSACGAPAGYRCSVTKGQVGFPSTYGYTGIEPETCPAGFVPVPGSTYFQKPNGICVMKYEARNVGNIATGTPAGTPWVNVNQQQAFAFASTACSGCRLMTDSDWLLVAYNMFFQNNNWTGGSPRNGSLFTGTNDGSNNTATSASSNDANGYINTDGSAGATGLQQRQRRTMTLSNGNTIWDMSGNVLEITQNITWSGQPGGNGYTNREWKDTTVPGGNAVNYMSRPQNMVSGIDNYTADNGLGYIYSSTAETAQLLQIRGGGWGEQYAGSLFYLNLNYSYGPAMGFRSAVY